MGTPVVRASGDVAIRAYGWKGIDPKEALVNVSPNYLTFLGISQSVVRFTGTTLQSKIFHPEYKT